MGDFDTICKKEYSHTKEFFMFEIEIFCTCFLVGSFPACTGEVLVQELKYRLAWQVWLGHLIDLVQHVTIHSGMAWGSISSSLLKAAS